MLKWRNIAVLFCTIGILAACAHPRERVYEVDEEMEIASCNAAMSGTPYASVPCAPKNGGGFLESRIWSDKERIELDSKSGRKQVNVAGVPYCPPHKRCPDMRLPPQPCAQPMPTYYNNVPADVLADGAVLIHPYTRAKVVCTDRGGDSAMRCAESWRAAGYVLVTDIPQLPASYDFLRDGTYPTRRWRNGETVPRW